ncbi:CBS domain-containing protein [Desulfitobacterium dichloroeliminans LMG P-21439]|uniref:CBS domain-containing protein n=1 Tax=Desulfitobacterium dichloroeliminans (strain LMG P-21439 / DCA1) TaxID=871963 RepID=L0F927_DESDL|nr:hemolysin family protein [Desulfitobacterium dichloroeliminans]AGA69707.1 CBS domain-containing protein [Desulfitobacterium dichloroeliminans LMG P-21439]
MVAALFLVALNAFFVAAEFSLVKVRKTRLAELSETGSKKATVALEVTSQLDAYLSASQLGITLASLGLGWLGEPAIATLLAPLFANLVEWDGVLTHTVSVVIAFLLITFLHIVLGELVPKSIAIQSAEKTALWTAGPLKTFYKFFYPIIRSLNGLANLILKRWGVSPANESDLAHTEEELRMLVDASQRHGVLDKLEGKLLDNVFEFSDRVVSEVMVPRQDMVCLYIQDSMEEVLHVVKTTGHTRYPLCDDDKDNVIGLVHMLDLLCLPEERATKSIADLKRDILIVPEGMPISHLVQKMRAQRTHLAVVVDEFGGTAGMVTIEDLIEELVGEIYDEFESKEQAEIIKGAEGEYLINGRVLLDDLVDLLEIDFEEETVSTLGGFVFNRLGRKPAKGDTIDFQNYIFSVIEVVGFRITLVKVSNKPAVSSLPSLVEAQEDIAK